MRVAIVIGPDATEPAIKAAIPQALFLQGQLNGDAWPSGQFVAMAAETQANKQFSYAQLARWGNGEIWKRIDDALAQYGDPHADETYEKTQVDGAVRHLIAIRGKRAAYECRQSVLNAVVYAKQEIDRQGFYQLYELVDVDMIKKAIRRYRRREKQVWPKSSISAIPKK